MFRKLIEWNRRRKEWRTEHVASWRGVRERGSDRLAPFQHDCEAALVGALAKAGLSLVDRTVESPPGNDYIRAAVKGAQVRVWIHDDTAGFDAPGGNGRFEEWDHASPAELIADFTGHVIRASRPAV